MGERGKGKEERGKGGKREKGKGGKGERREEGKGRKTTKLGRFKEYE